MPCPTCDHTMQNLGSPERVIFWCPRCGTLKEVRGDIESVELTANMRAVVRASGIGDGRWGGSSHAAVNAVFKVDRHGDEPPLVELQIHDSAGRRVW